MYNNQFKSGFLKRACEHGLSQKQANNLWSHILGEDGALGGALGAIAGGGVGGLGGAAYGAYNAPKGQSLKGALKGGLKGGGIGAGLGGAVGAVGGGLAGSGSLDSLNTVSSTPAWNDYLNLNKEYNELRDAHVPNEGAYPFGNPNLSKGELVDRYDEFRNVLKEQGYDQRHSDNQAILDYLFKQRGIR